MRLLISALLAALVCASAPVQTLARNGPPLSDLKSALDVTSWDSSEQGLILAIGPDKVYRAQNYNPEGELDDSDTVYAPRPGHGLRLATVARSFGRRLARFGTVSVVVPPQMVILNPHLKDPDIYQGLQIYERLQLLEATLSQGQWQLLGSREGIGLDDLSPRQAPILESMLPEATAVVKIHYIVDEKGARQRDPSGAVQTPLDENDIAKLRLRLDRTANIMLLSTAGRQTSGLVTVNDVTTDRSYFAENRTSSRADADTLYGQPIRLTVPNKLKPSQIDFAIAALNVSISTIASRTVGDLVNLIRVKSGVDIYVDGRLAKQPVYLRGAHGVRAGDVLQALCLALTGSIRKIGPAGTTAGNGKSDCAYILTNDIEGLGSRRARIVAWASRARQQKSALVSRQIAEITKQDPLQYFPLTSEDPMAPSPEIMHQIEENWSAPDARGDSRADVPIGLLTAAQRDAVRAAVQERFDQQDKSPRQGWIAPDTGKVRVNLMLGMSWVVPGFGIVRSGDAYMNSSLIPASRKLHAQPAPAVVPPRYVVKPVLLQNGTIAIAPNSASETAAIMDLAKAKGLRQVWIQAADDPAGQALLEDAVAAGKARGIPVCALIALMAAPKPAAPVPDEKSGSTRLAVAGTAASANELLDLNLQGETAAAAAARLATEPAVASASWNGPPSPTGDILAPEAEATLALETGRLERTAAISGIAGVCLKETSEPGHLTDTLVVPQFPGFSVAGSDFGYTVANRLRFVRAQGYDPIDLPTKQIDFVEIQTRSMTTLPFVDTDDSGKVSQGTATSGIDPYVLSAWKALRTQVQATLIHNLYIRAQKLPPGVQVYFAGPTGSFPVSKSTYAPWRDVAAADPPDAATTLTATKSLVGESGARGRSKGTPLDSYVFDARTVVQLRAVLGWFDQERLAATLPARKAATKRAQVPELPPVFDLTALPVSQVIPLLQADLADQTP